MKAPRFHLIELFAIVVVIVVAFCILIPWVADGNRRRMSRQSGTQMRGIHSGIVLSSSGNKDWGPGFFSDGTQNTTPLPVKPGIFGTDTVKGWEPRYRITFLLRGNFFSPVYMISPFDASRKEVARPGMPVTMDHFSYAMLRVNETGSGRQQEGRATNNGRAAMISDRNLSAGSGSQSISIDGNRAPWRGNVAFNDNHAEFEISNILSTNYNLQSTTTDDLFADDKDDDGKSGNDAAMVYQDESTYVNQK